MYMAPLVEPVFVGDPGRRLRKGMSSGGSPVCLFLLVCLSLYSTSLVAGAVPQGRCSGVLRGRVNPYAGLVPSCIRPMAPPFSSE